MRRYLAAALAASLLWLVPLARGRADEPPERSRQLVRSLTQEATAAFARREFDKAQQLLDAAYLIFPSGKIQYSLGRVYEAQNKPLPAMIAYQRFLRQVPPAERLAGQSDDVNEAIKRLSPHLGHIVIIGDPAVQYQLDDGPKQSLNPADMWVDPGAHRLTFYEGTIENVAVKAGATAMVHAPAPEPAPSQVVAPAPPPPRKVNKVAVLKWVLGGVGVAALGTGAVLWALDGRSSCGLATDIQPGCRALSLQYPGIGLVAGGGVLIVAAGVLFGYDAGRQSVTVKLDANRE